MKFITDIQEANTILNQYKGAKAQICMFSLSLKRLALRLQLPGISEVVFIIGAGCEYVSGNFEWDEANLLVTSERGKVDEIRTKVLDENKQFLLVTSGGFALVVGLLNEFGESFEHFLEKVTK
jgi:hypothetical protein